MGSRAKLYHSHADLKEKVKDYERGLSRVLVF